MASATREVWSVGIWAMLSLSACSGGDLPGHYWDVTIEGTDNQCTGGGANFRDRYEYRAIIEGNDLTLAIDDDIFATGIVDGCTFTYSSLVWSSYRDDFEIQWQVLGEARVNVGKEVGCVEGSDWDGIETFVISTSEHPDVSAGCTYATQVTGGYLREVQ